MEFILLLRNVSRLFNSGKQIFNLIGEHEMQSHSNFTSAKFFVIEKNGSAFSSFF